MLLIARFMVTINLDTEDRLINGSMGTIKYIYMDEANPLIVQFIFSLMTLLQEIRERERDLIKNGYQLWQK